MNSKTKVLILVALITTIIANTVTLSKYKTASSSDSAARVAVPIMNISSNAKDIKIDPTNNEQKYIFKVSNYDEKKSSEVTMKYNLKIVSSENLPLEFELYDYDVTAKKEVGNNLLQNNSTENVILDVGQNISNDYMLKIKWKNGENNYLYNKEIDYIQLIMDSEQID